VLKTSLDLLVRALILIDYGTIKYMLQASWTALPVSRLAGQP